MSDDRSENAGDCESTKCAGSKPNESEPEKEKSLCDRFWSFAETHIPVAIDENSDAGKRRNHCKEEIKFGLEICGFIIGVLVAGIFLYQSCQMRKATQDAEAQLNEMQEDRKLDERAFVFATGIIRESEISKDTTNYVNLTLNVEIKNSGKTPAFNFRSVIGSDNQTNDIPKIDTYDTNDFMVLAPGAVADAILKVKVKVGEPLWICGINRYDDIFTNHHWSTYCWQVGEDFRTFYGTPYHNSSDDVKTNQNR